MAQFLPHWIADMDSLSDSEDTSSDCVQQDSKVGVSHELYTAYLDHRRYLIDSEREAARSYDRWLLTLAGGSLGLSMAFAKDIAPKTGAEGWGWLLLAWLALVCAIALGLVCIYMSQKAHEDSLQHLDDTLQEFAAKGNDAGFWARFREEDKDGRSALWVGRLNLISAAAFVVGVLLLCVFAYLNVPD